MLPQKYWITHLLELKRGYNLRKHKNTLKNGSIDIIFSQQFFLNFIWYQKHHATDLHNFINT